MICPNCGKEFEPRVSYQKYCSRNCGNAANYRKHHPKPVPTTKTCKMCGKEFEAKNPKQVFCSVKCQRDSYHARTRGKDVVARCTVCNGTFVGKSWQKFCSPTCKRAALSLERLRSSKARKMGVDIVKPAEVAEVEAVKVEKVKPTTLKVIIPAAVAENRKPTTDELLDWIFAKEASA